MTGREIHEMLDQAGVLPSKQLGQNFLVDPNMARWIVAQLEASADDAVVEVGPGTGSLSEHLAGKVRRLILIEFDARLAAALSERFRGVPGVEVHHADGAKFDGRSLFKHRPLKFLGNLPYSSGGAILKNLLSRPHPFERAVIMLQKEVVDRLAASPGSKDYGVLSLRTQVNWLVKPLRTVPPEAFYPRPKIDSAVAVLQPRNSGLPAFDARLFDELIRRGFAQRRKQLKNQLPPGPEWAPLAASLGHPATVRGEELNLAEWVELTRAFDPHPLKNCPQNVDELFDVVDTDDQVTGTATRGDVHAKQLLHRAVHVFVFNKRGDLLLQRRSHLKDVHPGLWDSSVSGHLNAGEDYPAAALRELDEEMAICGASPTEVARLPASAATGWEHVRVYQANHDGPVLFPCAEVSAALWMPVAEIKAWIAASPADFAAGFLACWQASGL
ncbi:MAG: ribosomal RNA small subunit methyltransferase A [Verrucomicrobia bacterium]|nr:MAG: ribosomal RNA small subunit methyltransferase A [Verrucomicrobiota bacterium]